MRNAPQFHEFSLKIVNFQRRSGVRGAGPCRSCRVGRSPIRFFDLILNNALALRASQNRGKLPRGVCLCTTKSTKSTKSRVDGGEIARCGPLHHHRTIRRLWCAAFAPFRKPDAPNRTRPDASGRKKKGRSRTRPSVRPVSRTAVEKNAPA